MPCAWNPAALGGGGRRGLLQAGCCTAFFCPGPSWIVGQGKTRGDGCTMMHCVERRQLGENGQGNGCRHATLHKWTTHHCSGGAAPACGCAAHCAAPTSVYPAACHGRARSCAGWAGECRTVWQAPAAAAAAAGKRSGNLLRLRCRTEERHSSVDHPRKRRLLQPCPSGTHLPRSFLRPAAPCSVTDKPLGSSTVILERTEGQREAVRPAGVVLGGERERGTAL